MAHVMEESGVDAIANNMGVDATGQVLQLHRRRSEQYKGAEMNAMVNPGAITATSMVKGATPRRDLEEDPRQLQRLRRAARSRSNQEVFKSEADTNQRNQAIAMLMYAYGHIKANPLQATDIYTEQCAVSVNAKDLAMMAATLANGGKNPVTGKQVMSSDERARGARRDGDRGPLRRLGQVALPHRPARPRAASAAASSPSRPASSASRSSRRRSTRRATACRRRRRSPTSRTRSAATRSRRRPAEGGAGGEAILESAFSGHCCWHCHRRRLRPARVGGLVRGPGGPGIRGRHGLGRQLRDRAGPVWSSVFVAGMFTAGRLSDGPRFRAMTYDMLDAAIVNFAYTEVIKVAVGRERPNGEDNKSFPSGHTSNAFALAAVAERHYGWKLGVPAYLLAGVVGASRIQQDKHYLSDVVAGAMLGLHRRPDGRAGEQPARSRRPPAGPRCRCLRSSDGARGA